MAKTKDDLRGSVQDPGQLMRHFHFAIKRPVELTKAREIYEESLRLIEKHVEQGLRFESTDIPTNVSYESVLSVTHIQTLMELSGCMNGQFTGTLPIPFFIHFLSVQTRAPTSASTRSTARTRANATIGSIRLGFVPTRTRH